MQTKNLILGILLMAISCQGKTEQREIAQNVGNNPLTTKNQKIQVAILLDTSGSMNGLIEQAKSRLWNIVNTLTTLKYEGQTPDIEIALYEYGNTNISQSADWVRQIVPLSKDLDEISAKLFALTTSGGNEYCGSVIHHASKNLSWEDDSKSMKLVYIAGNEPFNQEGINYKEAIAEARKNNIYINTIYCGNYEEGIRGLWQDGAITGGGKYFNIDANQKVQYIDTPYDTQISAYNSKLNETYINYDQKGSSYKIKQVRQDALSEGISMANKVERSVCKTKEKAYDNSHWDLVDNYKKDKDFHKKINKEELPTELKGKSDDELKKIAETKLQDRTKIQKEIETLAKKRQEFIDKKQKESGGKQDDLGKAIEKSILEIGSKKGYKKV